MQLKTLEWQIERNSDFLQISYLKDIPRQKQKQNQTYPTKERNKIWLRLNPIVLGGGRVGWGPVEAGSQGQARLDRNLRQSYLSFSCVRITGVHHHTWMHHLAFCSQLNLVHAHLQHIVK